MARSRRRPDIYRQPGLFDDLFKEDVEKNAREYEETIVAKGGENISEHTESYGLPALQGEPPEKLRFISFGSGSSGNSAFLGNESGGFLIDAGVDEKKIETDLGRNGISMRDVTGIVITHDHHDHVSHLYKILRNNRHMAVFCTPRTLNGILRRHGLSSRIKDYHHPIYKEIPFKVRDFEVTAFEVSHDGTDNVGYYIQYKHHRFVVATDLGFIGERPDHYMSLATALMVESDYDEVMLRTGRYAEYLKTRIAAERGHLSNSQVADFLAEKWTPGLKNVFLCHLSKDNNTPAKAALAAREAILGAGALNVGDASEDLFNREAPVQLYVLPRYDASPLFIIR